jgi:hypothetical protein
MEVNAMTRKKRDRTWIEFVRCGKLVVYNVLISCILEQMVNLKMSACSLCMSDE